MKAKSSAHYQREYRKRLREQGLIKKEVWILPENSSQLAELEKRLRKHVTPVVAKGESNMSDKPVTAWNTQSLYQALSDSEWHANGLTAIELVEGIDPAIHIVMNEYGDLPVFLTVSGEQIIVESVLWSIDEVTNIETFNDTVLRTHKLFPLSTISLDRLGTNGDYYQMFGALSSTSLLQNVILEIDTLASNVIQATEIYSEFLTVPAEAI